MDGDHGVVRLTNISDFIAPNLDCIIPLETKLSTKAEDKFLVNIHKKEKDKGPEKEKKKEVVKISLADCLACNGCITSAETVLIEEQSLSRLWEGVDSKRLCVVTVSPQAVCSIAAKKNISSSDAARWISSYFLSRGITYVVDSSFGRRLALSLAYSELSDTPSTSRPVLASACPGFVCYTEKNASGNVLLGHVSKLRSPQAIHGALIKNYLALKSGVEPSQIFHASVMPCFDKKLEASREHFQVPGTEIRETDCVVSTAELFTELEDFQEPSLDSQSETSTASDWLTDFSKGRLIGGRGGTSGGYAEVVVTDFVAKHGGTPKLKKVNQNQEEIEVVDHDDVKLRVARIYGFRNIQNFVRKMKTGKRPYDYVEVMACPSGCGNGGGQIRELTIDLRDKQLKKVEELYNGLPMDSEDDLSGIQSIFSDWERLNGNWKDLLYTDYRQVTTNALQKLQW